MLRTNNTIPIINNIAKNANIIPVKTPTAIVCSSIIIIGSFSLIKNYRLIIKIINEFVSSL